MTTRRAFCGGLAAFIAGCDRAFAQTLCAQTTLEQVCLTVPARRVVTLDQQSTEFLLALGLQPVGATTVASYRKFTSGAALQLSEDVVDLGLYSAPNAELIMALAPDLIVGNAYTLQKNRSILSGIAPIAGFLSQPSGNPDQFVHMTQTLAAIARLVGREAEAKVFLDALEADLAATGKELAGTRFAGRAAMLGTVNSGVTGADIMLFNRNALPAQLMRRIGLNYSYDDARHAEKGFNVTTVETLIELQDNEFFYMPFNETGVRNLLATPVWRNLRFVRENRFHAVPYRLIHNGPISAGLFLRDLRKVLLG